MRFNAFADIPTTKWLDGKAGLGLVGFMHRLYRVLEFIGLARVLCAFWGQGERPDVYRTRNPKPLNTVEREKKP